MDLPTVTAEGLAWLTVEEMREVDRIAGDELGLRLEQMMENAGRAVATAAAVLLDGDVAGARIAVLVGSGGNGGGALVAARHLHVAGWHVTVHLSADAEVLAPVTRRQAETVRRFAIATTRGGDVDADEVVDGLLGYGQRGVPSGEVAHLIESAAGRSVVSVDVPSGLELATGTLHRPAITAEVTVTLAMPKAGLRAPDAHGAIGRLLLADIGIPAGVYSRFGPSVASPFGRGPLVEVTPYVDVRRRSSCSLGEPRERQDQTSQTNASTTLS